MTFVFLLAIAFAVSYFALATLATHLFEDGPPAFPRHAVVSATGIVLLYFFILWVSVSIENLALGNRVQHAMGGGFMVAAICFIALRDARVHLNRFQFAVFTFLVASTLGVGNEIAEYTLQHFTALRFAASITDTWLDLISNTVGAIIGITIFTPLWRIKKPDTSS